MKKTFLAIAGLVFLFFSLPAQELVLNEVMTANASSVLDKTYYNYTEWVEIYNPSTELRSLSGYYLSDEPGNKDQTWRIPNIAIHAKGFAVIWFDQMSSGNHASFRIRSSRELLCLYNTSGILIDSVRVEHPYRNCSYGRSPDGSPTWYYFTQPTQGTSNTAAAVSWQAPDVQFNKKGGFYSGYQHITLSVPSTGYTIRYTLDGSEPTVSSSVYTADIVLSHTTVVKARAFAAGAVPGNSIAQTYFINEHKFTIPMVSLSMNEEFLWDNMIGIYTDGTNGITGNCQSVPKNWNQEWERSANIEYYTADGTQIINTGAGVKIAGACSRGNPNKSFAVSFRDKYGTDNIRYPLFQSKQADRFTSFFLRNSGNDCNRTMMQDAFIQSLLIGEMDVDYQAYTPSAVYLNGEYWGILNTREKLNEGYLLSNYGLDEDSIDLLELDQVVLAGSKDEYTALVNFINTKDISQPANYQYVKDNMDVDEYINYLIAEIYSCNTDWPGNNLKYWQPKKEGGKWRWILYDMDFGFGLYGTGPDHNTLTFALEPSGPGWPNPPWSTLLFRKLVTNDEFTSKFIDKFTVDIYSIYNPARVGRILDSLKKNIATEMPYHIARWGGSMTSWAANIEVGRNWAAQRPDYMMAYLKDYFSLGNPCKIKITSNSQRKSFVTVNEVPIHDTVFEGEYFIGREIRIKALSDKNYKFKQWKLRYSKSENLTFIAKNSTWSYLDDNTVPASSWKTVSFDDNSWKSGNGQLGYGDGDETTILSYGSDANNKTITYYFRKKFTVSDPAGISAITINLLLDDGAVVYLNGNEIARVNMPDGTITSSTFASTPIADETVYNKITVNGITLLAGINVIAVELHQCSLTSTDIGFDLSASGVRFSGLTEETRSTPEFSMTLNSDVEYSAEFEKDTAINNLFINEICAKNTLFPDENLEYDDWIEIYNAGDDTVNLAGLYLTNDLQMPVLFRISDKVPAQTAMPPHSYKVLWADGQSEQGVLHLDFKLDKDGGEIGLAQMTAGGTYYIDSLIYPGQKTDYSYGRYADGTSRWFLLSGMTPGESNIYTGFEEAEDFSLTTLYPNPADEILTLAFDQPVKNASTLIIYSLLGREEMRVAVDAGTTRKSLDISFLAKGMYIVTIQNELSTFTTKLIKE
jgi:CotH kinase protein/Chitobiase/beta-hexosaminidase C-terminal domain/Secretion system C-terminal sorting domain/Lamin Tail Domain